MRAITVRQPWAWAIIHAQKDVENRTRNIAGAYRGPVAIHAGLAPYEQHNMASRAHRAAHGGPVDSALVYGAIIGVVDLVDVHPAIDCWRKPWKWDTNDPVNGDFCSPWAMPDHLHLELDRPRPLAAPIPWRGALGLWTVPDELEAAIREQVTL